MNKIETMKRKEIIENLKYVEKIAIEVQAMALAGIEAPEHHLISMDELEGLRSGSEFVLQALYETFPELMQEDSCFNIPVIDTCVVLTAKEAERFAKILFHFAPFSEKFIRRLKYGIYPGVPLRMREYIRARNKLSGHHRI